ncbi:MAG: hypothetical protein PHC34_03060 [Candidatus Gastranaerophilales bacterium]|nr:hypothetical protein [Candidatus Gastranaerophilales bacterium]
MKFLSLLKFLIVFLITVVASGAGYVGELPNLTSSSEQSQQNKEEKGIPPPIMPLAPKNIPTIYGGTIIRQNKYSKYQKDIDQLEEKLVSLKKAMLVTEYNQMQIFCAKVNLVDLYVSYIKEKYANKPERYYESYKKILVMDRNLTDATDYWRTTRQYMRMIYKSVGERKREEAIFKKKFDNSLQSVEIVLELLKDNMEKGSF